MAKLTTAAPARKRAHRFAGILWGAVSFGTLAGYAATKAGWAMAIPLCHLGASFQSRCRDRQDSPPPRFAAAKPRAAKAMFNWNDLVFFLELARHGRLMPAARRLKVDYTTVS